jgi:crotonobetainyl-CoA:carnitine CoA-transferase CaiB-like acyl-CoA transferase
VTIWILDFAKKLKLSIDHLKAIAPEIVLASIPGSGTTVLIRYR